MIGDVVGYCKVKPYLIKTNYFYGPLSELEGQTLKVMEQARDGSCLCLNPLENGLVDVHFEDIESFKPNPIPSDRS
jgi:hypothetical protein